MPAYGVEWTFEFNPPIPDADDVVDELLGKLASHRAVASVAGGLTADLMHRLSVSLTLDAPSLRDAATGVSWDLLTDALREVGIPADRLLEREISARDVDLQAEDLARPPDRYVGVSEVAEILGVSRQRASELRTRPGFPAPIADLASGPVWTRGSLDRFISTWERRPGRPARSSTRTGSASRSR